MAKPREWMEGATWIMPPERDTEDAQPVRGLKGWGQALAEICVRQYGNDPATLVPLLEKLEGE